MRYLSCLDLKPSIGAEMVILRQKKMGGTAPHFLSPSARLELIFGPASQIVDLTPLAFEFLLVRVDLSILVISCIFSAL
jgi:hypothetical protein